MNSGWKPTSVLYRPPSQVPLRAERTLLEAAVGADGSYSASSRAKSLRGSIPRQLVSLTTLRDNYLDLIRKEIAGLPRISSAVRIVMDPSDIDVTKAMLKYSRDSGLAVHLTVPVGHSDRENIFNVELAASILADTSPGPIELLVLGEEALSEQTLYHVEKVRRRLLAPAPWMRQMQLTSLFLAHFIAGEACHEHTALQRHSHHNWRKRFCVCRSWLVEIC
jgi:hypothetical protein